MRVFPTLINSPAPAACLKFSSILTLPVCSEHAPHGFQAPSSKTTPHFRTGPSPALLTYRRVLRPLPRFGHWLQWPQNSAREFTTMVLLVYIEDIRIRQMDENAGQGTGENGGSPVLPRHHPPSTLEMALDLHRGRTADHPWPRD